MPPRTYDINYKGPAEAAIGGFGKAFAAVDDRRIMHRDQALQESLAAVSMQDTFSRMGRDNVEAGGVSPDSPLSLSSAKARIGGMLGDGGYQGPNLQKFEKKGPAQWEQQDNSRHKQTMQRDATQHRHRLGEISAQAEAYGVRPGQEMQRQTMKEQFLDDLMDRANGDTGQVLGQLGQDWKRLESMGIGNSDIVTAQGRYKQREIDRRHKREAAAALTDVRQKTLNQGSRGAAARGLTPDQVKQYLTPEDAAKYNSDPNFRAFVDQKFKKQ